MKYGRNDSGCLADYRQATDLPATASAKQYFSFPRSFRMVVQLLWPCSIAPGWFRLSKDISKVWYSKEQYAEADLLAVMLFASDGAKRHASWHKLLSSPIGPREASALSPKFFI